MADVTAHDGASKLDEGAEALILPVSFFFAKSAAPVVPAPRQPSDNADVIKLLEVFAQIKEPARRAEAIEAVASFIR